MFAFSERSAAIEQSCPDSVLTKGAVCHRELYIRGRCTVAVLTEGCLSQGSVRGRCTVAGQPYCDHHLVQPEAERQSSQPVCRAPLAVPCGKSPVSLCAAHL